MVTPVLRQLDQLPLSAAQRLELEAFQMLLQVIDRHAVLDDLLLSAKSLQLQAEIEQHPLAQAAAFRALQWIQMRMRLHHGALESLARAGELYERCGQPQLVMQMRATRCRVLFGSEMYLELRQFCAELLARPEELTVAIHTMTLSYSASASYYLALEESDEAIVETHWRDCLDKRARGLRLTREHGLLHQECQSLLNHAVVHATRQRPDLCRQYLHELMRKTNVTVSPTGRRGCACAMC